jgi:MoaA/NifB/PqqE/SkfB family radical SAM enzyme
MINACTFITRRCPRACDYCNASKVKKEEELDWLDWVHVNGILRELGVDFNLILANETWILGKRLYRIMEVNTVPYAIYTTCPPQLFGKHADYYFEGGFIDNLSCGIDYSLSHLAEHHHTDMEKKSVDGWVGLSYVRETYPNVDCQGTITVNKQNYKQLPEVVQDLTAMGVFIGVNVIHWDKDGKFDFFPPADSLKDFMFDEKDVRRLQDIFTLARSVEGALIQNKEMLMPSLVPHMIKTDWHCKGDPYGGPTIDSDGSLRCCGYRKGERSSQYSIFDLPREFPLYKKAVMTDALNCPGCFWSYPWMYHYWLKRGADFGKKVFANHAGRTIPVERWSQRRIG